MHALMFQFKRAHLRALHSARALSYKTGLTPARYDLLRAVGDGREQSAVWRVLGISRATVSTMVRRLEALGLLQRRRSPRDKRTYLLRLTYEGSRRMARAFWITLRRRPFQRRFERAFGEPSWNAFLAVERLIINVRRVARHLGDTSRLLYLTKAPGERFRARRRPNWLITATKRAS